MLSTQHGKQIPSGASTVLFPCAADGRDSSVFSLVQDSTSLSTWPATSGPSAPESDVTPPDRPPATDCSLFSSLMPDVSLAGSTSTAADTGDGQDPPVVNGVSGLSFGQDVSFRDVVSSKDDGSGSRSGVDADGFDPSPGLNRLGRYGQERNGSCLTQAPVTPVLARAQALCPVATGAGSASVMTVAAQFCQGGRPGPDGAGSSPVPTPFSDGGPSSAVRGGAGGDGAAGDGSSGTGRLLSGPWQGEQRRDVLAELAFGPPAASRELKEEKQPQEVPSGQPEPGPDSDVEKLQ